MLVVDREPDPAGAAEPARKTRPVKPSRLEGMGYSGFHETRTLKFTSAVPLAKITPVSPPIFSPNSTTVSSGATP